MKAFLPYLTLHDGQFMVNQQQLQTEQKIITQKTNDSSNNLSGQA